MRVAYDQVNDLFLRHQKNPYSVNFTKDPDNPEKINIVQQSLFTILPSINWSFKF